MASSARQTPAQRQLDYLRQNAPRLSFYQAVLLLERLFKDAPAIGHEGPAENERIRIRPSVTLACPPSDVEEITPKDERVQVTTTFLGLYGVDSPLPSSFAEHMAQISYEETGERVRAFLDIFHHRLFSLLYRTWRRAQPVAGADDPLYDRLLSLVGYSKKLGLGQARLPRLVETRLLVLRNRTAWGLSQLLQHRLGYDCLVEELQARMVDIPPDQRSQMGVYSTTMGDNLVLGSRVEDCNRIRLRVAAASFEMFMELTPEGADRQELDLAMETYLRQPVDYDIEVTLPAEKVPPWRLGQEGQLGRCCWLGIPQPEAVWVWRCPPEGENLENGAHDATA